MIPGGIPEHDTTSYVNGLFGFQLSAAGSGDQLLLYSLSENAISLAEKANKIQHFFVDHTRLGIPMIVFDEALHGLVRGGATVFPQAIGLAASWDTLLMHRVSEAIAQEARARGIRDVLSPVINIASDVRWGRVEETYGEDPFLTSRMAVAFTGGFERNGIVTTPKHFIANVGDGGRDSYPIHLSERLLDEIYFPPFEACITESGARSVMTAYNTTDGVSNSASHWLLEKKLKEDWGFRGFVISDANAVGGDVVLHHTAADYPAAGEHAISGGLDVIFQTEYKHHALFFGARPGDGYDSGRINDAVRRVLQVKFELGLFDHPYTSMDSATHWVDNNSHQPLALQAARESIVLLKNSRQTLPLAPTIHRIAVIGPDAAIPRFGGYSGSGNHPVSILQALKEAVSDTTGIRYESGCGYTATEWIAVPASALSHVDSGKSVPGLDGRYYNGLRVSGSPVIHRTDPQINFHWTLYAPDPALTADFYTAEWTGQLRSPVTGNYKIGLTGNDGYRLYINGKLVIDQSEKQSFHTRLVSCHFIKDKPYDLRVIFTEPNGNASIRLIWNLGVEDPWEQQITRAVAAARASEVAVIAAGITEGEFQDRAMLELPGHQEELIRRVAATGKPVIVLLVGGSAITMQHWIDSVGAILDVWYPGEQGGRAIAEILFGKYNPAGRLPISFPIDVSQVPLVYNHKPTGRGDDYNNLSGLPLFPFGYGLSYTRFDYSAISLDKSITDTLHDVEVSCTVTNTGDLAGDEVVQLYLRDEHSSVATPVMALKGFQRIFLQPKASRQVHFRVTPSMLRILNEEMKPVIEAGRWRIMIGASSRDIRLKETLTVKYP